MIDEKQVLRSLYSVLLGREPDEEMDQHLSRLNESGNLNSIVSALVDSNEFKIKYELQKIAPALVEMSYLGLLGRPADPEGLRAYG